MAYESRETSCRRYYYTSHRVGGRVVKVYHGREGEPAAELAKMLLGSSSPRPRPPDPFSLSDAIL